MGDAARRTNEAASPIALAPPPRAPVIAEPWPARALGFAPLAGAVIGASLVFAALRDRLANEGLAVALANPVAILISCELLQLALASVLWQWYRAAPMASDEALPSLTVVIPAYNEGPMVERSIRSVANADYPRDRLELLLVDDGSRDDTYFHMAKLRRTYANLVRVIRFRGNQGKRAALRAGFEAARGEVVVTIDSDSEIEPQTLRAIASPFVQDPKVGGVAGWVKVLNRDTTFGKMLDVFFTLSFDFVRAAQSTYGAVFVCPGALSAFRRSVIVPRLESWTRQTFLGRPVGHGEDQALTNIVLREGYETVYQRTAVVRTLVPERYRQLARMLTRWDRSYLVEGFSFAKFMFTRYRTRNRVLPIVGFAASSLRLAYVFLALIGLPSLAALQLRVAASGLLAGIAMALVASLYYLRTERSLRFLWGVIYSGFAFVALQWVLPYAALTIRDERWGTR